MPDQPGKVSFEDRAIPQLNHPRDVIVQVKWTGICGSDVHYWTQGRLGPFTVEKPMVLGHESAGIVHSLGSSVSSLKVGDRVALEPGAPCRFCERCREGRYNLCADMAFAATPPFDGTLCRYYVIPEDLCYKLPGNVSLEEGALMEPMSVAVHICKKLEIEPGKSIVVFGAGPVGLLCCGVAKALGAGRIVCVDINEERVKFAKGYAATHSFLPGKDEKPEEIAARMIKECELGEGADAVVDATGAVVCIQTGIDVTRAGGIYCQAGMGDQNIQIPVGVITPKEVTIKGSFRYSAGDYATSLYLLSSGKIEVKSLISKKVSFKDAEKAFEATRDGKGIKVLIEGP